MWQTGRNQSESREPRSDGRSCPSARGCFVATIRAEDADELTKALDELDEQGYVIDACVVRRDQEGLYLTQCGSDSPYVIVRAKS